MHKPTVEVKPEGDYFYLQISDEVFIYGVGLKGPITGPNRLSKMEFRGGDARGYAIRYAEENGFNVINKEQ